MKEQQAKYSKLQYICWLISGSEISILKTCPTDYNRHAGIGFTIFMTSFFGAFAGGYAGYYFTKGSLLGSIVFGLIWGMLIFSIDRTMVVSLKKKPTDTAKNFVTQIVARGILAALIAFIISIPLELLIFKDNIDAGLSFYKVDQQTQLQNNLDRLNNPKGDSAVLKAEEAKVATYQHLADTDPDNNEFKKDLEDIYRLTDKRNKLINDARVIKSDASLNLEQAKERYEDGAKHLNTKSAAYKRYSELKGKQALMQKEILALKDPIDRLDSTIAQKRREWKQLNKDKLITASTSVSTKAAEIVMERQSMDSIQKVYDTSLAKIDESFVVRFDVLTFLANKKNTKGEREYASIFFLLWLIRILFFLIEILPTIAKVFTPFGMYDSAVFSMEENFKNIKIPAATMLLHDSVKNDNQLEKTERQRQQEYRLKKEGELHDKLVNEISEAQDRIARKVLSDWIAKNSG